MQYKNFFHKKLPTTIIFQGLNFLGEKLSTNISQNGGNVLILDEVTKKNTVNIRNIQSLNKNTNGEIKIIDTMSSINYDDILRSVSDINFSIFLANFEYEGELNIEKNLALLDVFFEISKLYQTKALVTVSLNKKETPAFNEYQSSVENKVIKEQEETKVSLVKIAEVYGENLDTFVKNSINSILESIKREEKIKIKKEHSFFHYVYIDDAVSGLFNILFSQKSGVFTLSNKEDISNISLAFRISDLTGFPVISIEPRDRKIEDRIKNPINILDDWEIKTVFEEGIRKVIEDKLSYLINNTSNIKNIKTHIDDIKTEEKVKKIQDNKNRGIDMLDFDNIKNNYLNENNTTRLIDRKPRNHKKKLLYLMSFIAIILVAFIIYTALIIVNYENSKNILIQEVSTFNTQSNHTLNVQNNKLISSEQKTINLLSITYNAFKYLPFYNNFYKTFKISLNISQSVKQSLFQNKNINNYYYNLSYNNKISSLSSAYNVTNLKYENKQINNLNLLSSGFKTSYYTYISKLALNNKLYIQNTNNNALAIYEMLSGNKNYTLVFYTTKNNTGIRNITISQYEFISIKNGNIVKIIDSPNAGDLNTTSDIQSLQLKSDAISTLVNNAFKTSNSGVIYINKSVYTNISTIDKNPNFIKGILLSNKKLLLLSILESNLNKNIYIYITNKSINNINKFL
jgi:hypothetical protein